MSKIHAVAGILCNQEKHVLISQRPIGKSYVGYWEFPGGKIEAGESPCAALIREFQEELGIDTSAENWRSFYQGGRGQELSLEFFIAHSRGQHQAQSREGQAWRWEKIENLSQYLFPEPNSIVIKLLQEQYCKGAI